MCTDCGCSPPPKHQHDAAKKTVQIEKNLLDKNDRLAAQNRARFSDEDILVINLLSSPGSGKTTLVEETVTDLGAQLRFAVLEGDQQTSHDADRIAATGTPAHQINTGSGCHLDAHMVGHGVEHFTLPDTDVLIIENVGNLVCPASFDLGEDLKATVLSVTEGDDKPLKYPQMFRASDVLLINKIDLLPHVRFDLDACRRYALGIRPDLKIFEISCYDKTGMNLWYNWLKTAHKQKTSGTSSCA
ncbi:MAG: hydrogenase accessory protein HypB [Desulfuromonas sp.]|nr:MAG: hydrogenase accessory protein HypB [Desulfuromonas sp.]